MRKNKIIEIQLAGALYVMRLIPRRKKLQVVESLKVQSSL